MIVIEFFTRKRRKSWQLDREMAQRVQDVVGTDLLQLESTNASDQVQREAVQSVLCENPFWRIDERTFSKGGRSRRCAEVWGCSSRRLVLPGVRVPPVLVTEAIRDLCDGQPQRKSTGMCYSYGRGVHGIACESVPRRSERLMGK